MPTACVVGLQWGDEAKARVLDVLSAGAHCVVRSQGGNNAGHTVVIGGDEFILHLVPTGVLRPQVLAVIGNGVVVDPRFLLEEVSELRRRGVEVEENLRLSARAHLVMPYLNDNFWYAVHPLVEQVLSVDEVDKEGAEPEP